MSVHIHAIHRLLECIAGISPGRTPSPVGNTASPSSTWVGYETGQAIPKTCSTFSVDDTIIDSKTGRRCYKVTCGTALLIRYPQHQTDCNANNYGQYCDLASQSSSYTSSLSSVPDTIYVNLASTAPFSFPFTVPLDHQASIFAIIDSFNVLSNSDIKDMRSVARTLPYIWQYGTYDARAVGFGYNDDSGNFLSQLSLSWGSSMVQSQASTWSPSRNSGSAVAGFPSDSPIVATVTQAASFSIGWSPRTFREFWVWTKSYPRLSQVNSLVAAYADDGPGAGIFVIFAVSPTSLVSVYQTKVCDKFLNKRCAVVGFNEYPNMEDKGSSQQLTEAKNFIGPIFAKSASLVGRLTVVEVDDVNNFATPPANTYLTSGVTYAPTWATQTGLPFSQNYPTKPVTFTLPDNWVSPTSPPKLGFTINFRVVETGFTIKTLMSWNEPPVIKVPTLNLSFKDTDSTPFYVSIVDSIRSSIDPNFNILAVKILSASFNTVAPNGKWVNDVKIVGGTSNGVSLPWDPVPAGGTQWYDALLGLNIFPKATPGGTLTLTYQLTDKCLVSSSGTIIITYSLSNTPPTAIPVIYRLNVNEVETFNLRDLIADSLTMDPALVINILGVDVPLGTLEYLGAGGTYTNVPTLGTTSSVAYQDLRFSAGTTSGTTVFRYRVIDEGGLYADSTITFIINKPPVISVNPASVTTKPTETGKWVVTITDTPTDLVDIVLKARVLSPAGTLTSIVTSMVSTNPIAGGSSVNLATVPIGTLISGIPIDATDVPGTVNIPMSWVPGLNFPYGSTVTLTFRAVDDFGLQSVMTATVVLRIPNNSPPVWRDSTSAPATTTTLISTANWRFEYPQDISGDIPIIIKGDDPNLADTEKLTFTITTFPDPDKGTLWYLNSAGTKVQLTAASPMIPLSADKSAPTDGYTQFNLVYVPAAGTSISSVAITNTFNGRWTDPASAQSDIGQVALVFTLVNKRPSCVDITATATQNKVLNLLLSGSDRDANLRKLVIKSHAIAQDPGISTDVKDHLSATIIGAGLLPKEYLTTASQSQTWTFTYLTNRYTAMTTPDRFYYTVVDAGTPALESTQCTVTITTTIVNQPPEVFGFEYEIQEGTTLDIPFIWLISNTSPWYKDVDGTQDKTTLRVMSNLVSTVDGKEGTLLSSDGTAVGLGYTMSGTSAKLVYKAPAQVPADTVISFKFEAYDTVNSPLVSKTSTQPGIIKITVKAFDDPPVISLSPPTIITTNSNWEQSFTVTVTDIDSSSATVSFTDPPANPIPWPTAGAAGEPSSSFTTITIKDSLGAVQKAYPGSTTPATLDEDVIDLVKVDGAFPTFTITWNAYSSFISEKSGTLNVQAYNTKSSNIATGNLKFLYDSPPNQVPSTRDVLIVVNEDSCAFSSTCDPTSATFRGLTASDGNTAEPEGDTLNAAFKAANVVYSGKFVFQATESDANSRSVLNLSSDTLTSPLLALTNTVIDPYKWLIGYEPSLNMNTGEACTCTATASVYATDCNNCNPIVVPFNIIDSRGGVSSTANLRVVVLPEDDAPLSQSKEYLATKGVTLQVDIPGTDIDGDLVCIVFIEDGTITFDNPTLSFRTGGAVLNHDLTPPAGNTFCITATGSGNFGFNFVSESTRAVSNVYPFQVRDENNNFSPIYTLTINLLRTPLAPTASSKPFTTTEDTPIQIMHNYKTPASGGDNENTYDDPDGTIGQTYIVITEIPPATEGTLYGPNGEEITSNTPIYAQNPELTFVPFRDWSGPTSYKFQSVDSEDLKSPIVTVPITVTAVDDPPTITMTPVELIQDRGVPGTFVVTVNDIDSLEIGVIVKQDEAGNWIFHLPDKASFKFADNTDIPSSGAITTVVLDKLDLPKSFDMIWTPSYAIPDTATGTFTLYAANENSDTSTLWDGPQSATSVTGTVGVKGLNDPPTIVVDPAYPYSFSNIDGKWSEHVFRLIGEDPQVYHTDVLTITIASLPEGVILMDLDDNLLKVGDSLQTPGPAGGDPVADGKTFVPVKIAPPASGFIGQTSFSFTVTDLVGATSAIQNIPIDIIRGNVPPTSANGILVLPEDYCTTSFCGVETTFATLKTLKYSTISANDDNGDKVWIKYFALPGDELVPGDASTKSGAGVTAWFPFGSSDSDYFVLNGLGPFSKPEVDPQPKWDIWFQPTLNQHSVAATAGEQHALLVDGGLYRPYSQLTFKVYDINPAPIVTNFPDAETAKADTFLGCPEPVCANTPSVCGDPAANGWVCTQVPDLTDHESPLYHLRIYVIPVNDPPTSQSLTYTIKEDEYTTEGDYLIIDIPFVDVDSTSEQVGVLSLGYGGKGTFYTRNAQGLAVPLTINPLGEVIIPRGDRQLLYQPFKNSFSDPGVPLSTLYFKVYDQGPLYSPTYTVNIYVTSVPDQPQWIRDEEITILEDSSALITLSGRDKLWTSFDVGEGIIFVTALENKGTFSQCNPDGCVQLKSGENLPFPLTEGKITYKPLPDENGLVNGDGSKKPDGTPTYRYSSFTFKLFVFPGDDKHVTLDQIPDTAIPLEIYYKINVLPVNDPPVLVPMWFPDSGDKVNECDEDTYLRVRFTATDIDSDCNSLEADALMELDPFHSSMYSCAAPTAPNCPTDLYQCLTAQTCNSTTTVENCEVLANKIPSIGRVKKIGPALWEVSFVPYPNYNGNVRMKFMVWDECSDTRTQCDLFSSPKAVLVHVRPINDAPTIVKGATNIRLEYYNDNREAEKTKNNTKSDKTKRATELKNPGENADDFTLVEASLNDVSFEVHADKAVDERILAGTVMESHKASTMHPKPTNPDESLPLVAVYRLTTQVQDIDFFFQYKLMMEASLIHCSFVPQLVALGAPCTFPNEFSASCEREIRGFNNFLSTQGFAIVLDEGAESGIGLFMLNDTGSVDKLNRPLASGFTIVIMAQDEPEELTAPIAAIVILPVIAAATGASIAAAWILLGQRAQDYATASFDAFTLSAAGTGTQSPLYNAQGREVSSPLYTGRT